MRVAHRHPRHDRRGDHGLLVPSRTATGYRTYDPADLQVVARIRSMIEAGLPTADIRRYLDCVRPGENGHDVNMCPDLRRALDGVATRLDRDAARIDRTREALCALSD